MYDFAHGQSDFFEGVTHSLCTLEFVVHRPLYDLFIDWLKEGKDLNDNRPRQTEFNKLNLSYTLMSKRKPTTTGRSPAAPASSARRCAAGQIRSDFCAGEAPLPGISKKQKIF